MRQVFPAIVVLHTSPHSFYWELRHHGSLVTDCTRDGSQCVFATFESAYDDAARVARLDAMATRKESTR